MPSRKIEDLPALELFALCIRGEAANQGLDGMLAVGSVVMNRAMDPGKDWWGDNIREVILAPKQFSCFNPDDKGYPVMSGIAEDFDGELKESKNLRMCYWIAKGLLEGYLFSNVKNATHYHTFRVKPAWRNKLEMITKIGDHIFYA